MANVILFRFKFYRFIEIDHGHSIVAKMQVSASSHAVKSAIVGLEPNSFVAIIYRCSKLLPIEMTYGFQEQSIYTGAIQLNGDVKIYHSPFIFLDLHVCTTSGTIEVHILWFEFDSSIEIFNRLIAVSKTQITVPSVAAHPSDRFNSLFILFEGDVTR